MRIISTFLSQPGSPGKRNDQAQFQGSGAAIAAAIAAGRHARRKREEELQAQREQMQSQFTYTAQYPSSYFPPVSCVQPTFQPSQVVPARQIHFGGLDWLTDTLSGLALNKGIEYISASLSNCRDDNNKKALAYLEQAHNSSNHSGQTFYLEKAEAKFLNAALALKESKQKAEAYKNLAIVSKMLKRDPKVTNSYAEKSMEHFDDYRTSIEVQRVGVYGAAIGGSPFAHLNQLRAQEAARDYQASDIPKVCSKLHTTKHFPDDSIDLDSEQGSNSFCTIL